MNDQLLKLVRVFILAAVATGAVVVIYKQDAVRFWPLLMEAGDNATNHNNDLLLLDENATTHCDVVRRSRQYENDDAGTTTSCNNFGTGPPRRLLVTCTGRSGTGFLETLLRRVGLRVGHDNRSIPMNASEHGAVSWLHAFNDRVCAYPRWGWRRRQRRRRTAAVPFDHRNFLHIVHIVRDPLRSMRSRWNKGTIFAFRKPGRCNTVQGNFERGGNATANTLRETLRHWVLWNSFIESLVGAGGRYRTEDINGTIVQELYNLAASQDPPGEDPLFPMDMSVPEIDALLQSKKFMANSSNSDHTAKPSWRLTWDMLAQLDEEYTVMAQLMALRYGYAVEEKYFYENHLDDRQQKCGFNEQQKWACSLVAAYGHNETASKVIPISTRTP